MKFIAANSQTADALRKTLDRVLSRAGAGSRTEARIWIAEGRVRVNGRAVTDPAHWVDPARDRITLNGKPLTAAEPVYILLYKPKGYVTTYKDPDGRPTVYDLVRDIGQFAGTVGRLDLDTSGLLLLTNDNHLADRLTSPDFHVEKEYLVKASIRLSDEQLVRLRSGIELDDGPTRPAMVTRVRDSEKYTHLTITITEGRNRQVRRMLEALGAKVLKLVRTRIGPLTLAGLDAPGRYRLLTAEEVRQLRKLTGLPDHAHQQPERQLRVPQRNRSVLGRRGGRRRT
jgi:pseudouridine synthase